MKSKSDRPYPVFWIICCLMAGLNLLLVSDPNYARSAWWLILGTGHYVTEIWQNTNRGKDRSNVVTTTGDINIDGEVWKAKVDA